MEYDAMETSIRSIVGHGKMYQGRRLRSSLWGPIPTASSALVVGRVFF